MRSPSRTLTALFQDDELGHFPKGEAGSGRLSVLPEVTQWSQDSNLALTRGPPVGSGPQQARSAEGGGRAACCTAGMSCA